jgi:hypothetical protein
MKEVCIIGVDLAKNVFQLHGAAADGAVAFHRRCRGGQASGSLPVAIEPLDQMNVYRVK